MPDLPNTDHKSCWIPLALVWLTACPGDKGPDSGEDADGPWLHTEALVFDVGAIAVHDQTTLTVYLINEGEAPVYVTALTLDDPSGAWSVVEGWATDTTTDPSGAEVPALVVEPSGFVPVYAPIEVQYAPTDDGLDRATLTVLSDDPGSADATGAATWTVTLRGQALWPCASMTPRCMDLGDAGAGDMAIAIVNVRSCSAVPVTLSGVAQTGDADVELGTALPVSLLPGGDTSIYFFWTASTDALESAELTLLTDAPDPQITLDLYGNAPDDVCGVDEDGDGLSVEQGDCDDEDASISPTEDELYDTIDNNCDGHIDEGTYSFDDDSDGYAEVAEGATGGDCDDGDAWVWPEAPEDCDGADNDCDGVIDEGEDGVEGSACAALE